MRFSAKDVFTSIANLFYLAMRALWIGLFWGLVFRSALAQNPSVTLTGRVLDAKTGEPIPFATVYLNNSSRGTNADQNGIYRLAGIPLGNQELVASSLGYLTARLPLRLADAHTRTADLKLEPSSQALADITVTAKHNKSWLRQFRTFAREMLGNRPQARQCRIENPNALSFQEEKGHLRAQASEPLIIDNQALGYRLYYDLLYFDYFRGAMQFSGTSRFEELKPTDARQQTRWQANRMRVYQGSIQHLMASLLTGTHEQAGYTVYRTPLTKEGSDRVMPFVQTSERQLIKAEQIASLFKPGELPFERRLITDQPLEIYYNRIYAANSPYRDSPAAYSLLMLPKGIIELTTNGAITQGNGLDARGYMGNDRLATLLPADWAPIDGEMLISDAITAGKPARPDARLDSLVAQRRRAYGRTAPVVYVQTDKGFYCTGDQLWYSIYVIDPARQLPVAGRNEAPMHLELLSATGQRLLHQWIRLTDGRAAGSFRLADSLASDQYLLRAYTDLDHPSSGPGFECSFSVYNLQQLHRSKPGSSTPFPGFVAKPTGEPVVDSLDVQFLPEGGQWLAGVPGRLGIKALQANGRGYPVSGQITDQSGQLMASFTTNALGMGQVSFTPLAGQRYRAQVTAKGHPQTVFLPTPAAEGWSLATDAVSDSSRLTISVRATGRYSQQPFYVTLQSREQLAYRQKWTLTKGEAHFTLSTATLPAGVCRLTVWDSAQHPRAERLVFIPERLAPIQMHVSTAKPRYEPRQEVVIGLQFRDADGYPVTGTWSAAVTDADQVPTDTERVDLRTYLLLTSELRGYIESPTYYLTPEHLPDLDNLLLTQGWRRLPNTSAPDSTNGWTLSGHVRDKQGGPLVQQSVLLMLEQTGQRQLINTITDTQGQFQVKGLTITDTLIVQGRVLGTGFDATVLTFDPPGKSFRVVSPADKNPKPIANWITDAEKRQSSWPAFYRDSTARQLAEVTVKAYKPILERPKEVRMASIHGEADNAMDIDPNKSFLDMKQLLSQVPGYLLVFRRNFSSFGDTTPLYLLDGVYTEYYPYIDGLNPKEVSRVEILRNSGASIYGARGANGVIAIYTRKGVPTSDLDKSFPKSAKSTLFGFATPRAFYVPHYTLTPDDTHKDQRDVLFWQPMGQTDENGTSRLLFPLSDTAKRLRIVLQGLTNEGIPMAFTWELPVR